MAKKAAPETQPAAAEQPSKPKAPKRWPADEFTGQEGTFERDPITGIRTKVADPQAEPAGDAGGQAAAD